MRNFSFSATLFYDGKCAICQKIKTIIKIIDINKKIRMVDLWSTASSNEFQNLNIADLAKQIHLIDRKYRVYTGYFAFKQVSKIVWLFFPLFLISLLPGIDYLGTIVYRLISDNRYYFGCKTCGKFYCKFHPARHR